MTKPGCRLGFGSKAVIAALSITLGGCLAGRLYGTEVENLPPDVEDDLAATSEDVVIDIDILANDTDPNGDPLAITAINPPNFGTAIRTGAVVTYQPNSNFFGADTFSYEASDPAGATGTATVTITVSPVNDRPVAVVPATVTVSEDGMSQPFYLTGTDPEDPVSVLSVAASSGPFHGSLSATAGFAPLTVVYTPDPDFAGVDLLEAVVTDSAATVSAASRVTFIVEPVNDPPVITLNTGTSLSQGGIAAIGPGSLAADDVDDNAVDLVFRLDVEPASGELRLLTNPLGAGESFTQADINLGRVDYDHDGATTAGDSFGFTLTDGEASVAGSFSFTIEVVGTAPVLVINESLAVDEAGSATITTAHLLTDDADTPADQRIYSIVLTPSRGALYDGGTALGPSDTFTQATIDAGDLSYTHDGSETVADGFLFMVTDGGDSVAGSFLITVAPVNDPPAIAVNNGLTLAEGASLAVSPMMLRATDEDNLSAQLTFTVTLVPGNGILRVGITPVATNGTFTQADIDGGLLSYGHDGSETSGDSFSFDLADGSATLAGNTFSITVTAGSDPPNLVANAGLTLNENATAPITSALLAATDLDNSATELVFTLDARPSHGQVRRDATPVALQGTFTQDDVDNNRLSYRHDGSETTADSFAFTVSDGTTPVFGNIFDVTITPVSDAPELDHNYALTVDEGGTGTITIAQLSASDVDNTAVQLDFTVDPLPNNGTLEKGGVGLAVTGTFTQADIEAGIVTYTHDGSETTTDWFNFTVTDGTSTSPVKLFNININPVNELPVATPISDLAINQDAVSPTLILTGTDTEDAPGALTVNVAVGPFNGNLAPATPAPAPLGVVYTPAAGFVGFDAFQFTVTDSASGVSAPVTVNVRVIGPWQATVDAADDSGHHVAMAVLGTRMFVAYHAANGAKLKVARSDDRGLTWPVVRDVGLGNRPSIGTDGTSVYVSYYVEGELDLEFRRSDDFGDTWSAAVKVDDTTGVGEHNDIAVEPGTGEVYVSYYDDNNDDLIVAKSTDDGATWPIGNRVVARSTDTVGTYNAIGLRGTSVFVTHYDLTNGKIELARSDDQGVNYLFFTDIDPAVTGGGASSLVVDCAGCVNQIFLAYYDPGAGLKFCRSDNNGGAWGAPVFVDSTGDVGDSVTMAVDSGSVFLAYYDRDNGDLRFARSDDEGDTWFLHRAPASTDDVGRYTALAVSGTFVIIAYYDVTHGRLELTRSSDGGYTW